MANILVIEDEPIIAIDIVGLMESMGHAVIAVARTQTEAIHHATQTKPDLILADVQLADHSNGIETVHMMNLDCPVVFITAFPEKLIQSKINERMYLLPKPFQIDKVKEVVEQALGV